MNEKLLAVIDAAIGQGPQPNFDGDLPARRDEKTGKFVIDPADLQRVAERMAPAPERGSKPAKRAPVVAPDGYEYSQTEPGEDGVALPLKRRDPVGGFWEIPLGDVPPHFNRWLLRKCPKLTSEADRKKLRALDKSWLESFEEISRVAQKTALVMFTESLDSLSESIAAGASRDNLKLRSVEAFEGERSALIDALKRRCHKISVDAWAIVLPVLKEAIRQGGAVVLAEIEVERRRFEELGLEFSESKNQICSALRSGMGALFERSKAIIGPNSKPRPLDLAKDFFE